MGVRARVLLIVMPVSSHAVRAALLKKGFREDQTRAHVYFWLYAGEQRTRVNTHISHGPSEDLGPKLVGQMARQLFLTKKEFTALVDCTVGGAEYLRLLSNRGTDVRG